MLKTIFGTFLSMKVEIFQYRQLRPLPDSLAGTGTGSKNCFGYPFPDQEVFPFSTSKYVNITQVSNILVTNSCIYIEKFSETEKPPAAGNKISPGTEFPQERLIASKSPRPRISIGWDPPNYFY